MLKCEDCNRIFDEAIIKRHFERDGEELDPPTYHCPHCNSEFIVTAKKCCICGEIKEYHDFSGDFCDECIEKAAIEARDAIRRHCTVMQVEAIKEYVDIGGIL